MDATALYLKLFPRRTYSLPGEDKKTVCGVKDIKAKDRLMAYTCSNVDTEQMSSPDDSRCVSHPFYITTRKTRGPINACL